jgi:ATP-dependent RNA helicase DDX3X
VDEDPFKANEKEDHDADQMFQEENTGIDFDAYEDIPVSTSGREVPDCIDSFTDTGLPDGLLKNVQVCASNLCSTLTCVH